MDLNDFTDKSPGRLEPTTFTETVAEDGVLVATQVEGRGFVPNPLPPDVEPASFLFDLYPLILAADRNLSLLEGTARRLPNPHLLTGVFARREAILSSAIEDTFASAEDLALLELSPTEVEDRDAAREVANYVRALEHALSSELPICLRLIRDLHAILLEGVRRPGVLPGEFRKSQNAIGRGHRFSQAKFVPPPPSFVTPCLRELEAYLNREDKLFPRLVRFAFVHYQFEAIHPFTDGNGRVGRLLITLMLCRQAQLSSPLVYVSAFLEQNRNRYSNLLYRVSTQGAWQEWTAFFLEAVASQAEDAVRRADRLLDLQAEWHELVHEKRASPFLPGLVDRLFHSPFLNAAAVVDELRVTPKTAGALIRRLVDKGILAQTTKRSRGRVYAARKIIELIRD